MSIQTSSGKPGTTLPRFVGLFLLCITIGLQSVAVYAQTSSDRGQIIIQSASLRETAGSWQLAALADIQLSPEMRQGLNSGVPLQFIVDFHIRRARPFWLDKTLLKYQHRYRLIYYELTRHYRLQSLTNNESGNYRSLLAALEKLGRLQGLNVNNPDNIELGGEASGNTSGELYGRLTLRLDDKALPLPLRPLLSSTWALASEDFAWSLN